MNKKAKEALEEVIVDWASIADVTVEVFGVDEMPVNAPGITINPDKEINNLSYRLVHMYIDDKGDWQLKWIPDDE